jgi:hypothetical protein
MIGRGGTIFVLALAATALAAAPAQAASTRAEYVAQVDQVCAGFTPQFQAVYPDFKKLKKILTGGRPLGSAYARRTLTCRRPLIPASAATRVSR